MKTRVSHILVLHKQGSALVKIIIILGGLGVLVFAGFQAMPVVSLEQEHQTFKDALETRIQSLSMVSLPDTKNLLTEEISKMLDKMSAQYEPHHIQVIAEEKAQKLSIQVWYSRPHKSLIISNPKQFYAHVEKTGVPVRIVQAPTLTPTPVPARPTGEPVKSVKALPPTPAPSPTPTIVVIRYKPAKSVTDATFTREVLKSPTLVMVNFWASWCGYCRKAMPAVDEASGRFEGKIKIVKVNVDKNKRTSSYCKVKGIPDFIFFKDGKIIGRRSGFSSKQSLFSLIQEYIE